jgi:hypothetical protein
VNVADVDETPVVSEFRIVVAPNPSATQFSLKLLTPSARPANLQVTDALGRVVEVRRNVQPNMLFTIGHTFRSGVYFAELVQDGKKAVVRLLKLQ